MAGSYLFEGSVRVIVQVNDVGALILGEWLDGSELGGEHVESGFGSIQSGGLTAAHSPTRLFGRGLQRRDAPG